VHPAIFSLIVYYAITSHTVYIQPPLSVIPNSFLTYLFRPIRSR